MTVVRALLLSVLLPAALSAQQPDKPRPFSLFARLSTYAHFRPNRSECGIYPLGYGDISSTTSTCRWPYTASNSYLFTGGLQVAGIIGADGGPWAGDTSGVFFLDLKGTTEQGEPLTGVYLSNNPADQKVWPAEARIPGGATSWFREEVRGQIRASEVDAWSMMWDGNAALRAGRTHPLGIAVETRHLGWSYPRGNDDIQYLVFTIYNITASDPAVYATQRPEIRDRLIKLGQRYHANADSALGVQLPAGGYTLSSWFAGMAVDPDVGDAGSNYMSANVPLATLFNWDHSFSRSPGWIFELGDNSPPFFAGAGFYGLTVLGAPDSGFSAQMITEHPKSRPFEGAVTIPKDVFELYRLFSGSLGTGFTCNQGDPVITHMCVFNGTAAHDARGAISARGGSLPPGASATFVLAATFSAPLGPFDPNADVGPGDPRRLLDPVALTAGANKIDSIAGFQGYSDLNGDGVVQGGEIRASRRSMIDKIQLARTLFSTHFLLPQAPVAPDFFLIPGDNQVTVIWQPSPTEQAGDPYFASASTPTIAMPEGMVPNPLYDPNYRQFDVEGYRVYRGRTNTPEELVLLAQFDYAGTVIKDYTGRVNPTQGCAPELGIRCDLDSLVAGQPLTRFHQYDIAFEVVQVRDGDRIRDPNGVAYILAADTIANPANANESNCLCNLGVPFQFVDRTARNGFTYFYLVTAFDVNSYQSGPSSMESGRDGRLRPVKPVRAGSNVVSDGSIAVSLEGRGKVLHSQDSIPTLDDQGRFSGPFPPANGWTATPLNFAAQVFAGTQEARLRLDSLALGQADLAGCCGGGQPGIPTRYFFTLTTAQDVTHLTIPVDIPYTLSDANRAQILDLFTSDPTLSARYGGAATPIRLDWRLWYPSSSRAFDWFMSFLSGSTLSLMNGARWFDGPSPARNEALANPTSGNCNTFGAGCSTTTFNNAGALTGVTTVYQPQPYAMFNREWRNMSQSMVGAHRAADYNLYWGAAGHIDSVVDVTHNVVVPFGTEAGGTWGILNTSAQGAGGHDNRPTVLTPTDWTCVEPFRSRLTLPTSTFFPCASPAPFALTRTAELGQIAFGAGDNQSTTNPLSVRNPANLAPQPGFALYLAGTITQFALGALPPSGTVWSMRDYAGVIYGSPGATEFASSYFRPWTAVGTELVVRAEATNTIATVSDRDLRQVHTVPDPFYYDAQQPDGRGVEFVNLPARATIRIYSASGTLIRLINHEPASSAGDTYWDLKTRNGQRVASGVYFYHVESSDARRVGRMTIVNYTD